MCLDQVGPPEDLETTEGGEGEAVPQIVLDDAPSLPSHTERIEASEMSVHTRRIGLSCAVD